MPAKGGSIVTAPVELTVTGIVEGVDDTYSSDSPVRVTPLVSTAVATSGCGVFSFTTTGLPVVPVELKVIDAGGQVEKNPAELAASDRFAEINTDPGSSAVATPF